jgi:transposase InsO family protein
MYMAYSKNPHLPRLRMQAVRLIQSGWSYRKVARHTGFSIGSLSNWAKKAGRFGRHGLWIPTESSRPKHHPQELKPQIVQAIVQQRLKNNRCAEVVHQELLRDGIEVSLSSVKRTLDRQHLLKKNSPWKKVHRSVPRPGVVAPGDLVQVDTIHFWEPQRFYVYTLLDVYSRFAFAAVRNHATTRDSLWFVRAAQKNIPFSFAMLQSDNGPEFASGFSLRIGTPVRHSRVRKPNDNAHLERFNRTLQEECFQGVEPRPKQFQKLLPEYLHYYNTERLHMGLEYQTPEEVFRSY